MSQQNVNLCPFPWTSIWEQAQKTCFLTHITTFFGSFFYVFHTKHMKKHISTSVWVLRTPNAGPNIQLLKCQICLGHFQKLSQNLAFAVNIRVKTFILRLDSDSNIFGSLYPKKNITHLLQV